MFLVICSMKNGGSFQFVFCKRLPQRVDCRESEIHPYPSSIFNEATPSGMMQVLLGALGLGTV